MKYMISVAVVFLIINEFTLPMVHARSCKSNSAYRACRRYCSRAGCYIARCSRYNCRCSWCPKPKPKKDCPPTPPFPGIPVPPGC